jgi:hypothetical protein
MEDASAAISSLGFELDLMERKVLMRIRGGARCKRGGESTRATGVCDWMEARVREIVARLRGATAARAESNSDERKKRANGVNLDLSHSL